MAILVLNIEGWLGEVRIDEAPDGYANDSRYVLGFPIDGAPATATEHMLCKHIILAKGPWLTGLLNDLFPWEPSRYLEHTAGPLLAVIAVAPKYLLGLSGKSDRNVSTSTPYLPLCYFLP